MEQVHIRPCTPEDLDAVLRLERLWEQEGIAYGDFNPMSWEMFDAALQRDPTSFLVADMDGQLVGYVHAAVQRVTPIEILPAQEPYVEIENIYVRPDFRNQNIGGALLEQLFDIARQQGIQRFVVGTRSTQTDAILRFYRSHGFTPWSIQFFR